MMKTKNWASTYVLTETSWFDARRGYKKCKLPGVDVSHDGYKWGASADFWRDKSNNVVVRFASLGYQFSFEARLASGATVPDEQMNDFADYIGECLSLWLIEGVDDTPSTDI